MDSKLIKNLNVGKFERAKEKDFGGVDVYKVVGDELVVYYWNSSNDETPRHDNCHNEIIDNYLDDILSGTFSDGFNEIMFEI
tara:strand:+ start:162 stop:407 length:246 start_codon:yes stop_codon:yes gene_type:complete